MMNSIANWLLITVLMVSLNGGACGCLFHSIWEGEETAHQDHHQSADTTSHEGHQHHSPDASSDCNTVDDGISVLNHMMEMDGNKGPVQLQSQPPTLAWSRMPHLVLNEKLVPGQFSPPEEPPKLLS